MSGEVERRCILVVEDSDEDFETLERLVRRTEEAPALARCARAEDCLRFFDDVRTGRCGAPALVLLDLNLPGVDGRDLLAALREHPAARSTPIVVLSTSSNPLDVANAYIDGASGYLVKPVDLQRFARMLQGTLAYWFDAVILPEPRSLGRA